MLVMATGSPVLALDADEADLAVLDLQGSIEAGPGTAEITVVVGNQGPATAVNVIVGPYFESDAVLESVSSDLPGCDDVDSCTTFPELASGATVTLTLTVRNPSVCAAPDGLRSSVTVDSSDRGGTPGTPDPDFDNNHIPIACEGARQNDGEADMVAVPPSGTIVGGRAQNTLTLVARNLGPDRAFEPRLDYVIPTALKTGVLDELNAGLPADWSCLVSEVFPAALPLGSTAGSRVSCSLYRGYLEVGSDVTLNVPVDATPAAAGTCQFLSMTVRSSTNDPLPANNAVSGSGSCVGGVSGGGAGEENPSGGTTPDPLGPSTTTTTRPSSTTTTPRASSTTTTTAPATAVVLGKRVTRTPTGSGTASTATQPASTAALAQTGLEAVGLLRIGLLAIAFGVGILCATRSRRPR